MNVTELGANGERVGGAAVLVTPGRPAHARQGNRLGWAGSLRGGSWLGDFA